MNARSPRKSQNSMNNPENEEIICRHRPSVTCKKCADKPPKFKSIALLKEDTPIKLLQLKGLEE